MARPTRVIVAGQPARLSKPLKSTAIIEVRVKATMTAAEKRLWAAKREMVVRWRIESRLEIVFIIPLLSTLWLRNKPTNPKFSRRLKL
jgi:hypothetical protein